MDPFSLIGAGAGLLGSLFGGDDGPQQTATKEPWEPARKPLINSLNTGQDLERYYQLNPFNPMQQTGYQNLYADLDQFRNQTAPGLMQFANRLMNSNYQRGPRNSQMEAMQSQMPMQAKQRPQMMQQGQDGSYAPQGSGELLGAMGQAQGMGAIDRSQGIGGAMQGGQMSFQGAAPQGLLAPQGVFQAPTHGNYGLLDWVQRNPFTATNGIPTTPVADKPAEKTPEQLAEEERRRRQQSGEGFRGEGA